MRSIGLGLIDEKKRSISSELPLGMGDDEKTSESNVTAHTNGHGWPQSLKERGARDILSILSGSYSSFYLFIEIGPRLTNAQFDLI